LAAELKQALDVDSELVAGHGGVFEVTVDGENVFSKRSAGRFPEEGEVLRLLRSR
jgi:selenoprotein W-related protein